MHLNKAISSVREMMGRSSIRTPAKRECEQCGRQEAWDETAQSWTIQWTDAGSAVGNPHCIHEWDINGSFLPYK